AFACWRGAELNPWFTGPALSSFVEPPPEPAAGKSPTGPFSLADRDATTAMLLGAGWIDVQVEPHDLVVRIERDTLLDDGMMHFIGVADEDLDAALAAADAHLDQLAVGDGRYDAPLAFQVVTATNPR
ncbi:MAG: hypothetical protein ACRDV0_04065, partial [Acidimicrobiales bacterium]